MSQVISKKALKRLKGVHRLSRKLNGPSKRKHLQKLLTLAEKHIDEILFLYKKKDPHYLTEIGDLLILCFEILIENKKDVHETMELCFSRYEQKLKKLLAACP